jgi:hypothetical protein
MHPLDQRVSDVGCAGAARLRRVRERRHFARAVPPTRHRFDAATLGVAVAPGGTTVVELP